MPNIGVPESPQIGIWGQWRLQYLRTRKKVLYTAMLIGDALKDHLEEVDKSAEEMFDQLTVQMKAYEGVTEELKTNNQMEWVQRMNNIRNRAAVVVHKEWDLYMRQPNRILDLSMSEYRQTLHGLIHFRNKLIQQGRHTDAVDELLIKLQKTRRCRYG